jgi:hypothetical protein
MHREARLAIVGTASHSAPEATRGSADWESWLDVVEAQGSS